MSDQKHWVAYHVKDPSEPQPDGSIRIMCMSDTHSLHELIPQEYIYPADIAVHAGDFTNVGKREDVISFREWFKRLPTKYKILIAGNHDISFDENMRDELNFSFRRFRYKESPELSKREINCICRRNNCRIDGNQILLFSTITSH